MPQELPEEIVKLIPYMEKGMHFGLPLFLAYPWLSAGKTGLTVTAAAATATSLSYNAYEIIRNQRKTDGSERAACLIHESPLLEYPSIVACTKGRIALNAS